MNLQVNITSNIEGVVFKDDALHRSRLVAIAVEFQVNGTHDGLEREVGILDLSVRGILGSHGPSLFRENRSTARSIAKKALFLIFIRLF